MSVDPKILRHNELLVTSALTDRLLAQAYFRYEEEGLLPVIFYQGVPTLKQFLDEHLEPGRRIAIGCFREMPDGPAEFCGLGWVFGAAKMGDFLKAECGMAFFKRQSNKKDNLLFGRLMLRLFFDCYGIHVIFGTTPEPNKLALRYSQKLGFDLIGPVPDLATWNGELCPAWVSHMSREQFLERGY